MTDKHYIIIAPHPDDEIIGCYSLLYKYQNSVTVAYGDIEPGCQRTIEVFNITNPPIRITEPLESILDQITILDRPNLNICLVAPDPHFETHPDHRYFGMAAETLYRTGLVDSLLFYSTIMRAPYIFKLKYPERKRVALNHCYPEKSDLWKYDHRYWLFEGLCQWHMPCQD